MGKGVFYEVRVSHSAIPSGVPEVFGTTTYAHYGLTSGDHIRLGNTGVSWGQPRPAYQTGGAPSISKFVVFPYDPVT